MLFVNLGQSAALVRLECLVLDLFAFKALLKLELFLVALAARLLELTVDLVIQPAQIGLLVD